MDLAVHNDEHGEHDMEDAIRELAPRCFEHGWNTLMQPIARLMAALTFAVTLVSQRGTWRRFFRSACWSTRAGARPMVESAWNVTLAALLPLLARGATATTPFVSCFARQLSCSW